MCCSVASKRGPARCTPAAKIGGYCHLNLGEEATIRRPDGGARAARTTSSPTTASTATPSPAASSPGGHGRAVRQATTGVSGGRGGSMHLFDAAKRFMGGYAIVGGQFPLAVGAALRSNKGQARRGGLPARRRPTNIGAFYESLNLASSFSCRSFSYREQPTAWVPRSPRLVGAGAMEGRQCVPIHGEQVDGADVLAVRDAARRDR